MLLIRHIQLTLLGFSLALTFSALPWPAPRPSRRAYNVETTHRRRFLRSRPPSLARAMTEWDELGARARADGGGRPRSGLIATVSFEKAAWCARTALFQIDDRPFEASIASRGARAGDGGARSRRREMRRADRLSTARTRWLRARAPCGAAARRPRGRRRGAARGPARLGSPRSCRPRRPRRPRARHARQSVSGQGEATLHDRGVGDQSTRRSTRRTGVPGYGDRARQRSGRQGAP